MRHLNKILLNILLLTFYTNVNAMQTTLPIIDVQLGDAKVTSNGQKLIVSTNKFQRVWEWSGYGFITSSLKNLESNKEWCKEQHQFKADWSLPGLIDNNTPCKIDALTAKISNDDGYTSKHIELVAQITYETNISIKYIIWVYPEAPGLRTQLKIKALQGMNRDLAINEEPRGDYLPINWKNIDRKVVGYYNHTQERNAANLKILKEEIITGTVLQPENYNWASIFSAMNDESGVVFIKESHKCVNQFGLDTGSFVVDSKGLTTTGWGLKVTDLTNEWRSAWANWCLVYTGKQINMQKQIKRFDRMRYPINKELDIYILANTWGSNNRMEASTEENVLKEIEVQSELGIDVQQIDDGWQNPKDIPAMSTVTWKPDKTRYPNGWKNVVSLAKSKNLKLGVWFSLGSLNDEFLSKYGHNWAANLEDLKQAYDDGRFTYYKFDMINLHNYDELEHIMKLSRNFVDYTNRTVRINWDVTENEPRTGYFFGREYGNIYLANRTTKLNSETGYVPYLMLRDAWHVSKFLNLNKFQISVQNIERTDKKRSDAHLHNNKYVTAIALMGSPLFFQETHYYTPEARKEIKALLAVYKKYRKEMFEGYVFPIGDEPDDRSWTGFQNHLEDGSGFLMIFRELNNSQNRKKLNLNFCYGKKIEIKNLISGEKQIMTCDANGGLEFIIENSADFLFLSYKIID